MTRFLHYVITALVTAFVVEVLLLAQMPRPVEVPYPVETPVLLRYPVVEKASCPPPEPPVVVAARPAKPARKPEPPRHIDPICLDNPDPICGIKRQER